MRTLAVFLLMASSLVANLDDGAAFVVPYESGGSSCSCGFEGFYVGFSGGVATPFSDLAHESEGIFLTPLGVDTLRLERSQGEFAQNRPYGELNAGWGCQRGAIYLGARVGVNVSSFRLRTSDKAIYTDPNDEDYSIQLHNKVKAKKHPWEFTFDFKPGYVFCNQTMLFATLGGAYYETELHGKSRLSFTQLSTGEVTETSFDREKTKSELAFRWGLGLEHLITSCVSLQVSYTYTHYKKLTGSVSLNKDQPPLFSHKSKFKADPTRQVILLGVAYYF